VTGSKQSEAKAKLEALFTAEKAFMQEKDRYSELVGEMGFSPERGWANGPPPRCFC